MRRIVIHVVGARPNFMKAAPVLSSLARLKGVEQILVHTGQHYDRNMSDIFFEQLGMPAPNLNLEVGSGSQSVQTAQIMMRFEEVVLSERPDMVIVYGDVNSTVAATLVSAKERIAVAHVEAGLRPFDRSMPEEINRLVTDQLADVLFTPSEDGNTNLAREGVPEIKVHLVGNVMIDTLVRLLPRAELPAIQALEKRYVLVTLHRPSNVDQPDTLKSILDALCKLDSRLQVVFPIHPRTRRRIEEFGMALPANNRLLFLDPVGYLEFLALQRKATAVVTDSGGIQEESTFLGVPCLTLRENTERPVTVSHGTNLLIGRDMDRLRFEVGRIADGKGKAGGVPALWDGKASERIASVLAARLGV